MEQIKPCPFCGGEAIAGYALADYNRWGVSCQDCGALVEVREWIEENTEAQAIKNWNRRWKQTT